MTGAQPASGPALEIVAGHPSAEELAAVTAALAAVLAARGHTAPAGYAIRPGRAASGWAASGWADRARLLGAPLTPGRDAWRRSARPGQGSA